MQKRVLGQVSALLGMTALSAGCPRNELKPVDLCANSTINDSITTQVIDKVDLLFMVDNSSSMKEEQDKLAAQLPKLATVLARGEYTTTDGTPKSFPPVKSLRLAVVSSDMGAYGKLRDSCGGVGDDGLLLHDPVKPTVRIDATTTVDCAARETAGAFSANHLQFDVANEASYSTTDLSEDFACITQLGTSGCGLEQQLESVLKSLTPSTSDIRFAGNSKGHGDRENAGFLRDDSILAIVVVTDEEDCSLPDNKADLFDINVPDPLDETIPGSVTDNQRYNLGSRCAKHGDDGTLFDVSRYIEGLKALRPGREDLLVFAAITGVPLPEDPAVPDDLLDEVEQPDGSFVQNFEAILDHAKMQTTLISDPSNPNFIAAGLPQPACSTASDGSASPARRITQVAQGFGSNGIVRSICASDFSSALDSIINKIANQLGGGCIDRGLVPNELGLVQCDIVEYLRPGEDTCDASKGRVLSPKDPLRTDDNGVERTVCKINQVAVDKDLDGCELGGANPEACLKENPDPTDRVAEGTVGWYYDDFSDEKVKACGLEKGARISFTVGAEQQPGSLVKFECLQPVYSALGDPKGKEALNKPCADGRGYVGKTLEEIYGNSSDECEAASTEDLTLRCQLETNTCQAMCREDNNCPNGWECEKTVGDTVGYCVNPICPPG